jgi:hypothetical protein
MRKFCVVLIASVFAVLAAGRHVAAGPVERAAQARTRPPAQQLAPVVAPGRSSGSLISPRRTCRRRVSRWSTRFLCFAKQEAQIMNS